MWVLIDWLCDICSVLEQLFSLFHLLINLLLLLSGGQNIFPLRAVCCLCSVRDYVTKVSLIFQIETETVYCCVSWCVLNLNGSCVTLFDFYLYWFCKERSNAHCPCVFIVSVCRVLCKRLSVVCILFNMNMELFAVVSGECRWRRTLFVYLCASMINLVHYVKASLCCFQFVFCEE